MTGTTSTASLITRGIDTTTGGTSNSTSLITSGAVYTALADKSAIGHGHTASDISGLIVHTFTSPLSENATTHEVSLTTVPVSLGGTGTTSFTSGKVLIGNGTSAINTLGIDTTTGGTANSSELITSGAVYDVVSGLSPTGHHHNMSDIDNAVQGVYYVVGTQTTTTGN